MESCIICYTNNKCIFCNKCKDGTCLDCYNKLKICPFCRDNLFGNLDRETILDVQENEINYDESGCNFVLWSLLFYFLLLFVLFIFIKFFY